MIEVMNAKGTDNYAVIRPKGTDSYVLVDHMGRPWAVGSEHEMLTRYGVDPLDIIEAWDDQRAYYEVVMSDSTRDYLYLIAYDRLVEYAVTQNYALLLPHPHENYMGDLPCYCVYDEQCEICRDIEEFREQLEGISNLDALQFD